ncbi:MAG: DUF1707 SHOCT-like domain-containing protein [Longimicrobiales bacterium]
MEREERSGLTPIPQERRQNTIDALVRHYAADHITVDEFERRVDVVHRTQDPADLIRLTADLPEIRADVQVQEPEADRLIRRGAQVLAGAVRESQTLVAIMGGVERRGNWTPARRTVIIAFMGGAELDFRDARFGPGVTEVFIFATMGGVEIVVPPDLPVDTSGIAIMGGFEHRDQHMDRIGDADDDAPRLHIRGFVLMGGVEVSVRRPGESAKDANRRIKAERKRRRFEEGS